MASNVFFGTRSIVGAATAVTIDSLIRATPGANQAAAYAGSGIGCALQFYSDSELYVGTSSSVTDTAGGGKLPANIPFSDNATGMGGNICDPTVWYVYAAADATITVMFRGL